MKQHLEAISDPSVFMVFWKKNQENVAKLREFLPYLKTEQGRHYGEILSSIYTARLQEFAAKKSKPPRAGQNGTEETENGEVHRTKVSANIPDPEPLASTAFGAKPVPAYSKRISNKEHLRFVASQSCLVCGRTPSQAHHIKFAQPRAMSRKVSDEWTVPLCNLHHRALHSRGDEKIWWEQIKIDPIREARHLWVKTKNSPTKESNT